MITKFLLAVQGRPTQRPSGRPRPGRRLAVALTAGVAAALIGPAASFANHAPEACTTNVQNGIACVTVADTPDPVSYSAYNGNETYLGYTATVTNRSRSGALNHVGLTEALPAGTSCVSATTSQGTVSCSGETATAAIGKLTRGESATVEVAVSAPETTEPDPPETTITNVATLSFAANNPNAPGKDATTTYSETTTVTNDAGQTYCPAGKRCQVGTDPAAKQYANVVVPNPTTDLLVTARILAPDTFCVLGQATILVASDPTDTGVHVCRDGGFADISVLRVDNGEPYVDEDNPMTFHLRWDEPLTSFLQEESNFVVFHRADATAPVRVIGNTAEELCDEAEPPTTIPCIENVKQAGDGSWSVDLVKAENGHMR